MELSFAELGSPRGKRQARCFMVHQVTPSPTVGAPPRSLRCSPKGFRRDPALSFPRNLQVFLGKHNLQQREFFQEESSVIRTVAHPGYNAATHDQDIMLLRLSRPPRLSDHIQPLALERDCSANHTSCHILGWGKMADGQ